MRKPSSQYIFLAGLSFGMIISGFLVRGVFAADATINATVPAICGNGVIEGGESCDGAALGGNTCVTQGFDAGNLSCTGACTLNTSACSENAAGGGGGGAGGGDPIIVDPVDPVDPNPEPDPVDPENPEEPVDPENPEEPIEPEEPVDPENPEEPAEPEVPEDPADPEEELPEEPVDPQEPVAPENPEEPVGPQEPQNPDQPQVPVEDNGRDPEAPLPNLPPPNANDGVPPANAGGRNGRGGGGARALQVDLIFWIAERSIQVVPQGDTISSLSGDVVTVATKPGQNIEGVLLTLQGSDTAFKEGPNGQFFLDVRMPGVGSYPVLITTTLANGQIVQDALTFDSQPLGEVVDRSTKDAVVGAKVTLFALGEGKQAFDAGPFKQANPIAISERGLFGFVVPNGTYQLVAEAEGYKPRQTFTLAVRDNVVNDRLQLIEIPPTFEDVAAVLESDAPALEKAAIAADLITDIARSGVAESVELVTDVAKKVDEVADDPVVEEVTEEVVAPSVAGATAVVVVPSMWTSIISFFRYIFLQPLLLFGRRKRKEWGVVYNSLTKLPLDLAVVRLIDPKTKRIKQSRVTDTQGRFLFVVEPGEYAIEVTKNEYAFPSNILKGVQHDGDFLDVYHGGALAVSESGANVVPSIPLDPEGADKPPKRIKREKVARRAQHVASLGGVGLSLVSLYVTPGLIVGGLVALQVVMYAGFVRFVKPKKPKGWGIVSDKTNKEPIKNAVVRLFSKKYNKLVATQITDNKGRYAFLVGPNEYYVKTEKSGYQDFKSEDIQVKKTTKNSGALLKKNVAMVHGVSGPPAPKKKAFEVEKPTTAPETGPKEPQAPAKETDKALPKSTAENPFPNSEGGTEKKEEKKSLPKSTTENPFPDST